MAKLTTDELMDLMKDFTLVELSDFVKQFEDTFGVTAAAPVAVAAAPAAGAASAASADVATSEQDEFDVILESAGDKRIHVIKEVRVLTSLGLREAKDLVEAAPKTIFENLNKAAAVRAKNALESAGATVTLARGMEVNRFAHELQSSRDEPGYPDLAKSSTTHDPAHAPVLEDAEVVRALSFNVRRWTDWLRGSDVSRDAAATSLSGLTEVATAFVEMWDAELFADWFFEPSMLLDGASPADLVELGNTPIVLAALEDAAYGVYA